MLALFKLNMYICVLTGQSYTVYIVHVHVYKEQDKSG